MVTKVTIACISWIDQKPLPSIGFRRFAGAAVRWVDRVMMGLVATSNPAPGPTLPSIGAFFKLK